MALHSFLSLASDQLFNVSAPGSIELPELRPYQTFPHTDQDALMLFPEHGQILLILQDAVPKASSQEAITHFSK